MQSDVKVGLIVGVLLVAVTAVVYRTQFFPRGGDDKFTRLLPQSRDVKTAVHKTFRSDSPSNPYPVQPKFLSRQWFAGQNNSPSTKRRSRRVTQQTRRLTQQISRPTVINGKTQPKPRVAEQIRQPSPPPLRPSKVKQVRPTTRPVRRPPTVAISTLDSTSHEVVLVDSSRRTPVAQRSGRVKRNRTYTVQGSDTLIRIARQLYRNESAYLDIYEANRDILGTPDDLTVGMVLRLPE